MKIYNKISLPIFFFIVLITTLQRSGEGQNSALDYLRAHNVARGGVGVRHLLWDEKVTCSARDYVMKKIRDCILVHSTNRSYGENLAIGGGNFSGQAAVELWVKEKSNFNYASNSCVQGQCLHYTQVVWHNSTRLGCARARCNNGLWFISCNYDPPGNYIGQRPY